MNQALRYYVRVTTAYPISNDSYTFLGVFVRRENFVNKVSAKSYAIITVEQTGLNTVPREGQVWELLGEPTQSLIDQNGFTITQYRFVGPKAQMLMPETAEEFINFIAKEPDFIGIGEQKARRLFEEYGTALFKMLQDDNLEKVAESFTPLIAESLANGYKKYANLRYAAYLADLGVPPSIQQKLFKYHKHETIARIEANPYLLQHFGLGFEETDNIALERFNISEHDPTRLNAIVEYAMQKYCKQGHTFAHYADLWSIVLKITQGDQVLAEEAIESAQNSLIIYCGKERKTLHHTSYYIMESVIAKRIKKLLSQTDSWVLGSHEAYNHAVSQFNFPINERQAEAIMGSLEHKAFVVCGGAGTGKTTVMKAIVDAFHYLNFKVYGIALSGRAAKRLQESVHIDTHTIQRFTMLDDEEFTDDQNILVVIDEASMVDVSSLYKVIRKLPTHARLVFSGDDEQLPPIGAGLVLSELIKSNIVPNVQLNVVERQDESTGIPTYSNSIRHALIPSNINHKNISFILKNSEQVVDTIVELYREANGDAQIIVPTVKLAQEINEQCQAIANPYGKPLIINNPNGELENTGLRLGDPVIFTKNDYKIDVQNGTLGTVISVERGSKKGVIAKVEIDTGQEIEVTTTQLDNLELAYAITLHKAQGSQFKTVITAIIQTPLIDKSWVYTAITRAVVNMIWVGDIGKWKRAIATPAKASQRNVYLANLLEG